MKTWFIFRFFSFLFLFFFFSFFSFIVFNGMEERAAAAADPVSYTKRTVRSNRMYIAAKM